MQYTLLIYDDEKAWAAISEAEKNAIYQEYFAFTTDLQAKGSYVDGAPLQPTSTATTVRVRDGEPVVTDGPFAETKEQLGGFYLIEAESIDEALDWAARIPGARYGSIEVRPVLPVGAETPAG